MPSLEGLLKKEGGGLESGGPSLVASAESEAFRGRACAKLLELLVVEDYKGARSFHLMRFQDSWGWGGCSRKCLERGLGCRGQTF
jgi:hypothetical protein